MHRYQKEELKNLIEPFIYTQLSTRKYESENINSRFLLRWNRFDLAFKLFYLELKEKNLELAIEVYAQDIKAQTLGEFCEYGNNDKNSFEKYIQEFDIIFEAIKKNGFDKNTTIIPISRDKTIYNGAHRVASAIYLDKKIDCVKLDLNPYIIDYQYFYERSVPLDILDMVANKFIEYADDVYLAFLWPSGIGHKKEAEAKFSNIVYKKEITLSAKGGLNLLIELYKHMDWAGNKENGYVGINQKLLECFPNFNSITVLAFQADSLEKVREIKDKVRNIYNIGFSSIHITDTKEEAVRISQLIFNENGVHFLNHALPYKYLSIHNELDEFKNFLLFQNINLGDVIIDSSTILALYGIRKNNDLDYLSYYPIVNEIQFDTNDRELSFHTKNKVDLLYNQKYFFQYKGFKFISFNELYIMKSNRNKERDIHDCKSMDVFIKDNKIKNFIANFKQKLYYMKIKIRKQYILSTMYILKQIGLYRPIKWLYHNMKSIKK